MHLYTTLMLFATITLYGDKLMNTVQISYALHCIWVTNDETAVALCARQEGWKGNGGDRSKSLFNL